MTCTNCAAAPVYCREHCRPCYDRLTRTGELPVLHLQRRVDFEEWLASVIGTSGCWVWPGGTDGMGYGRATVDGKRRKVHQHVWTRLRGPAPVGLEPDHLCRNILCGNPECLEWVTHKVNMNRGNSRSNRTARRGVCDEGHRMVGDNVITARSGRRRCRACHLAWRRERRAAGLPA